MYYTTTKGHRGTNSNEPDRVANAIYEISGYETVYDSGCVIVVHPPDDQEWVNQLLELGGYTK